MKEFVLTDAEAAELGDLGISKPQWVLAQLLGKGFTLERPIRYIYDSTLQRTRMVQYEYAPEAPGGQRDFDMDLSSDEDWARALELLVPDPVPLCEELAHDASLDSAPTPDQQPAA